MAEDNILIIEDNDRLRKMIGRRLKKEGFRFFEAASGKDGLKALKENEPVLLLLDIELGDMTGYDILLELRKNNREIPVIILSALSPRTDHSSLTGNEDYLPKPFMIDDLMYHIRGKIKKI